MTMEFFDGVPIDDLARVADVHVLRSFSDGGKFYEVTLPRGG